jgi:hypothetical protein
MTNTGPLPTSAAGRRLLLNRLVLLFALAVCTGYAHAGTVSLSVGDSPPLTAPPLSENASFVPAQEATWIVFGRISDFGFAIEKPEHLTVLDGENNPLPLTVETITAFREFGDIIALTFAFELDARTLAKGSPRAEWGPDVRGAIRPVDSLSFPTNAASRLHGFTPDAGDAAPSDAAQFATIEIIADSNADKCFLWYLLPMAVIFVLLILRKRWTF